jgi:hypothetical protein
MPERELAKPWDIEAVSQTLQVEPQVGRHVIFGKGYRFELGQAPATMPVLLDLYPEPMVARLRAATAKLDLAGVTSVEAANGSIRIDGACEQGQTALLLAPNGAASLSITPIIGLEERRTTPLPEVTSPQGEVLASEPKNEKKPGPENRVVYTGRIGKDPHTRVTPKGVVVTSFPLAVHEGEQTTWHKVLFFEGKARKAAEALQKGDVVELVGYTHTRTFTGRDGKEKTVTEVNAAFVPKPMNRNGT